LPLRRPVREVCDPPGSSLDHSELNLPVIAIDNSPIRLALARHNAAIYGVVDRIDFVLADFVQFAKVLASSPSRRSIDVVFLSPPWGGINYQTFSSSESTLGMDGSLAVAVNGSQVASKEHGAETTHLQPNEYGLANLKPIHGKELVAIARQITPNVAIFLPRNQNLREVADLVTLDSEDTSSQEKVEVEEEWMGSKLKALTCYLGGLVEGQGHLWP
jgi:trimethylguanosine synthase